MNNGETKPDSQDRPKTSAPQETYRGIPPIQDLTAAARVAVLRMEALHKTGGKFEKRALDVRLESADGVIGFLQEVELKLNDSRELMGHIGREEERWRGIANSTTSDIEKNRAAKRLAVLRDVRHAVADLMARREPFGKTLVPAETSAGKGVPEKGEMSEKERRLMEEILRIGGASMFAGLPKEYSPSGSAGTVERGESRRKDSRHKQATIVLRELGLNNDNQKERLEAASVHEVVRLMPMEEQVTTTIEVEAPGLAGKLLRRKEAKTVDGGKRTVMMDEVLEGGSRQEPVWRFMYATLDSRGGQQYRDYSGRPGQVLAVDIALPEKTAKELQVALQENPVLARKIVEAAVLGKMDIPRDAWQTGNAATNNHPLRPPYEAWAARGESKMYFVPSSGEYGFDPLRLKTIKKASG